MSANSELVAPPRQGKIKVIAVSAAAGLNQLVNEDTLPENDKRSQYYTFICDVDCSITFHQTGDSATDPDPAAVAGDARTFVMTADTEFHWYIDNSARFFDHLGSGAGLLRWFRS